MQREAARKKAGGKKKKEEKRVQGEEEEEDDDDDDESGGKLPRAAGEGAGKSFKKGRSAGAAGKSGGGGKGGVWKAARGLAAAATAPEAADGGVASSAPMRLSGQDGAAPAGVGSGPMRAPGGLHGSDESSAHPGAARLVAQGGFLVGDLLRVGETPVVTENAGYRRADTSEPVLVDTDRIEQLINERQGLLRFVNDSFGSSTARFVNDSFERQGLLRLCSSTTMSPSAAHAPTPAEEHEQQLVTQLTARVGQLASRAQRLITQQLDALGVTLDDEHKTWTATGTASGTGGASIGGGGGGGGGGGVGGGGGGGSAAHAPIAATQRDEHAHAPPDVELRRVQASLNSANAEVAGLKLEIEELRSASTDVELNTQRQVERISSALDEQRGDLDRRSRELEADRAEVLDMRARNEALLSQVTEQRAAADDELRLIRGERREIARESAMLEAGQASLAERTAALDVEREQLVQRSKELATQPSAEQAAADAASRAERHRDSDAQTDEVECAHVGCGTEEELLHALVATEALRLASEKATEVEDSWQTHGAAWLAAVAELLHAESRSLQNHIGYALQLGVGPDATPPSLASLRTPSARKLGGTWRMALAREVATSLTPLRQSIAALPATLTAHGVTGLVAPPTPLPPGAADAAMDLPPIAPQPAVAAPAGLAGEMHSSGGRSMPAGLGGEISTFMSTSGASSIDDGGPRPPAVSMAASMDDGFGGSAAHTDRRRSPPADGETEGLPAWLVQHSAATPPLTPSRRMLRRGLGPLPPAEPPMHHMASGGSGRRRNGGTPSSSMSGGGGLGSTMGGGGSRSGRSTLSSSSPRASALTGTLPVGTPPLLGSPRSVRRGSWSARGQTRALVLSSLDKEVAREVAAMRQIMRKQEDLLPFLSAR